MEYNIKNESNEENLSKYIYNILEYIHTSM